MYLYAYIFLLESFIYNLELFSILKFIEFIKKKIGKFQMWFLFPEFTVV